MLARWAFLPGITDTTTLEAASTLCGDASWKLRGQDHASRHPVATPDMIRQLPAGTALVIRGDCAPVIARLPRAWNNPAYRRARRRTQLPDPSLSWTRHDSDWGGEPDPDPAPGSLPGDGTELTGGPEVGPEPPAPGWPSAFLPNGLWSPWNQP